MLARERGILLRTFKYGDTSLILHCQTREHGMISLIAKGVRRQGSRLAAVLQEYAELELLFYYREQRDLQQLKDAHQLRQFQRIVGDYEKFVTGSVMLELLDRLHPSGSSDGELYDHTLELLAALDESKRHHWNFLFYFFLYHFYRMGIAFHPERCLECGCETPAPDTDDVAIDLTRGGVYCEDCRPPAGVHIASQNVIHAARYLLTVEPAAVNRRGISEATGRELFQLLDLYLRQHVDYYRGLKSAELLLKTAGADANGGETESATDDN